MNINCIYRTKQGLKRFAAVSGYEGPEDLERARDTIKEHKSQAVVILFLIPQEQPT